VLSNIQIVIKQTPAGGLPITFGNMTSRQDGGMVYLKNGMLVIDTAVIADIKAN